MTVPSLKGKVTDLQFCAIKEAFGKHKGQSVNWLKVSNASAYGGTIAETSTMHETELPLAWGTVTVDEYGLSIPFSFKIEALSEFDIKDLVRGALLDDCVKVLDGVVERQFNSTLLRYVGVGTATGSVTTDGTATATNTSALNKYHVRQMVKQLKIRNVPGYSGLGGDYVCIAPPDALEDLKESLESVHIYNESGLKKVLNGEIGRFDGVRFVEDTWATRYTFSASARTATEKSWTKGYSLDAYLFGSPTVREAIAVPEEIRIKTPTDYGRSHGIAWYAIGGWALEWATSGGADSRIIKWDSKA